MEDVEYETITIYKEQTGMIYKSYRGHQPTVSIKEKVEETPGPGAYNINNDRYRKGISFMKAVKDHKLD